MSMDDQNARMEKPGGFSSGPGSAILISAEVPHFLIAVGRSSSRGGSSLATLIISAVFTLLLAALIGAALKFLANPGRGETAGGRGSGTKLKREPKSSSPPRPGADPSIDLPSSPEEFP